MGILENPRKLRFTKSYATMKSWKILENRCFGLKKILEKALFYPGKSWNILEFDPWAGLATLVTWIIEIFVELGGQWFFFNGMGLLLNLIFTHNFSFSISHFPSLLSI